MNEEYTILKDNVIIPLIAHIPHSATYIPPDLRSSFLLNDAELQQELLLMTDRYVDDLFAGVHEAGGITVIYNTSRLVLDPERFEDDKEEEMFRKGMGVIYTNTSNLGDLRNPPSENERKRLLNRFYKPYHKAIEQEVQDILNKFGRCTILDCHSFPSSPLPYENDQDFDRPDVCVGTDEDHTPDKLTKIIQDFCNKRHLKVFLNKPFGGTYMPIKFYEKNKSISSVMIEINRGRYMNEKTGKKVESFSKIKQEIDELIKLIINDIYL